MIGNYYKLFKPGDMVWVSLQSHPTYQRQEAIVIRYEKVLTDVACHDAGASWISPVYTVEDADGVRHVIGGANGPVAQPHWANWFNK